MRQLQGFQNALQESKNAVSHPGRNMALVQLRTAVLYVYASAATRRPRSCKNTFLWGKKAYRTEQSCNGILCAVIQTLKTLYWNLKISENILKSILSSLEMPFLTECTHTRVPLQQKWKLSNSVCRSPRSVISGSEQAFSFTGLYLTLNISLERHFSVKTAALAQLWGGSIPLAEEGRAGTAGASTSLKKKRHRTQSSTCQPACRQTRLHMSDHSKLQELGNHG